MAILKEIALDFLVASGFFPMCHQFWREGRLTLDLAMLTMILLDLVMGEGGTEGLSCLEHVSKESFDVNLVVPRSRTHDGSYQTNKNKPRRTFVTLYKKFHFLGGTFYIPEGSSPPHILLHSFVTCASWGLVRETEATLYTPNTQGLILGI